MPLARVRLIPAGADRLYGNVATMVASLPYFHPRETEPGHESTPARGRPVGRRQDRARARHQRHRRLVERRRRLGGAAPGRGDGARAAARRRLDRLEAAGRRARRQGRRRQPSVGQLGPLRRAGAHGRGDAERRGDAEAARGLEADRHAGAAHRRRRQDQRHGRSSASTFACRACSTRRSATARCSAAAPAPSTSPRRWRCAGVERVVRLGPYGGSTAALAVVGRTWWHAQRGAAAIRVEWRQRPAGALDTRGDPGRPRSQARAPQPSPKAASPSTAAATSPPPRPAASVMSSRSIARPTSRTRRWSRSTARRESPTARSRSGRRPRCRGWRATIAAEVAGVAEDAVTVHVTYLGGGFGRRLDVDFVGQAVRIALETGGRPVQLIWSREEDLTHDFYRPAAVAVLRAGLDARRLADAAAHHQRRRRDHAALDGARHSGARRPGRHARQDGERGPVRPAVRRRPPAHRPRRDAERRADRLLALGRPFAQRLLRRIVHRRARARGRQGPARLSPGAAQGRAAPPRRCSCSPPSAPAGPATAAPRRSPPDAPAASRCTNASAASSPRSSRRRSRTAGRACIASSAPPTSAPSSIRASSRSRSRAAVIFALSAALHGRIDIVGGVVQQSNFPSYPVVRLAESPRVETHLVASTRSRRRRRRDRHVRRSRRRSPTRCSR